MSHPLHHSISSQRQWGGHVDDYLPIHDWFDATRVAFRDMRHRSMRHHEQGILWAQEVFGTHITNQDGAQVAVSDIGRQHCLEDVSFVPDVSDWLRHMKRDNRVMLTRMIMRLDKHFIAHLLENCSALSQKEWGGQPKDYLPIHRWFEGKFPLFSDIRYQILRHHVEGIFWAEQRFGIYLINSDGRMVPVRAIGEIHVKHTVGHIPTVRDYLEQMR